MTNTPPMFRSKANPDQWWCRLTTAERAGYSYLIRLQGPDGWALAELQDREAAEQGGEIR